MNLYHLFKVQSEKAVYVGGQSQPKVGELCQFGNGRCALAMFRDPESPSVMMTFQNSIEDAADFLKHEGHIRMVADRVVKVRA